MKLLVISASQRPDSLSKQLAATIVAMVGQHGLFQDPDTHMIDLSDYRQALWDADASPQFIMARDTIRKAAAAADAIVYIVPEWSGMAPPLAKNFFLLMDDQIAHKPGLLVAVSAGNGGAYPIFELRASSYKNTKICWIPEHIILRGDALNALKSGTFADHAPRLLNALEILSHYAKALTPHRKAMCALSAPYPYGM